ncbi:MAG: hypothetical protein AAGD06_23665 [Acidobacteriota bacterium]
MQHANLRRLLLLCFGAVLVMMPWGTQQARADESPLAAKARAFFEAKGTKRHAELALAVAADPSYDPAAIGEALHGMEVFPTHKPGRRYASMGVGYGQSRRLVLRIPKGYSPDRAWPLIYCLHASGSTASSILRRTESLLGSRVDEFVLAAPDGYRQTSLDAPPPFTPEHPVAIQELRKVIHVDSDRVYAMGYSLGGYASWTTAVLHSDMLGGAVPMASCPAPWDMDGVWEAIGPNFQHLPVLHVWGTRDGLNVPGFEGRAHSLGSMSDVNRKFSPLIRKLGLNVIDHPVQGAGHGGARPKEREMWKLLEAERVHYPAEVSHRFRHIHQASTYWLEGHAWKGPAWDDIGRRIKKKPGESNRAAFGRVFVPLLGELSGRIEGQTVTVRTKHLSDFTVWLGDGMIDWNQPVKLVVNGVAVFEGRVEKDLGVLLAQAKRSYDFERLRWAGLRVDAKGKVKPVTADMKFPGLIRR